MAAARRDVRLTDHPALHHLGHRPWPLPTRPWAWRQTWHDLLFLHWPVPVASVRGLVPAPLDIQQFAGSAWVGVIPFWMSGVTRRGWPGVPGATSFPELNVRTYVSYQDRPGVWFFSLDAASRLAVWAARRLYHLPYEFARMRVRHTGERIEYRSARPTAEGFEASYSPAGTPLASPAGSLEHWLTERYCLYAWSRRGALQRAEVHHEPWPLQPAAAEVRRNDMLRVHGIQVDGPAAHVRYARRMDVVVWPLHDIRLDAATRTPEL
jgi:uncharacterized protein YqjF (DUF2071 family)